MSKFLRIGVHQSNVSGYTSKAWCVRRVGSTVFLKWGAVEVRGVGDGRRVYWTSHRGPNRFVGARLSVPTSTQKPQSRGDATIAMNYWPEKLRSGVEPPSVAPSSNKRSPRSSLSISFGLLKKLHGWAIRVGHR